jgi:hypothetical protein
MKKAQHFYITGAACKCLPRLIDAEARLSIVKVSINLWTLSAI